MRKQNRQSSNIYSEMMFHFFPCYSPVTNLIYPLLIIIVIIIIIRHCRKYHSLPTVTFVITIWNFFSSRLLNYLLSLRKSDATQKDSLIRLFNSRNASVLHNCCYCCYWIVYRILRKLGPYSLDFKAPWVCILHILCPESMWVDMVLLSWNNLLTQNHQSSEECAKILSSSKTLQNYHSETCVAFNVRKWKM